MDSKKLVRKGKVKEVYDTGDDTLEFVFTDNISVFDKILPTAIEHKGAVLCGISTFWFKKCAHLGIPTHFIDKNSVNTMTVKKFRIIKDPSALSTSTVDYLIPLEVIARYYVAGSFYERVREEGIKYGEKLAEPIIEFTTKFETFDRLLNETEAMKIGGLNKEDVDTIKETALKIDDHMQSEVGPRGLLHVDGKKEFAFDRDRNLVLVDTFGTPDEDRFWDMQRYTMEGEFVELSKEYVRNYYRRTGYASRVQRARENRMPEPEIPPLPPENAQTTSQLYLSLYEKITGEPFR